MKAAFFERHGGAEVLRYGDLDGPQMGPADVRIRVKATALNHLDLFVREGWPGLQLPLPHVGGTDLAGVVAEVGKDVADVAVGDEVLVDPGLSFQAGPDGEQIITGDVNIVGETRWGGLAEECVVPATHVRPRPDGMSWEEAAALPLCAITAMQMVDRKARIRKGDRLLLVGAGGGVSVMALQIAKARGAFVVATTGGPEKVDKVKALGADVVIDYKTEPDWSRTAFKATDKRGFHAAIDSVGEATFAKSLRSLAPGGRLVTCGATTGPAATIDIRHVFWKQVSVLGSTMGVPEDLAKAIALYEEGKLRPVVDSVWPLAKVRDAQIHLANAAQFGKVVLTP